MLSCALELKEVSVFGNVQVFTLTKINAGCQHFIEQLAFKDCGNDSEKCCKILDLQLSEKEWDEVPLLLTLMVVCSHFHPFHHNQHTH